MTFPIRLQAINTERTHVRNAEPGIYRDRDEIREILTRPSVLVVRGEAHFGRTLMRLT